MGQKIDGELSTAYEKVSYKFSLRLKIHTMPLLRPPDGDLGFFTYVPLPAAELS